MRVVPLGPAGAHIVELEPIEDERGSFARSFCRTQFIAHGLEPTVAQCNVSTNRRAGTLRGLHYQREPHGETKLMRCVRGSAYAVVLDIRERSATFGQWWAARLTEAEGSALYVPRGFASGFQTLEDQTVVHYQMSAPYHPASARGIRWDDPRFAVAWPAASPRILSAADANRPDYEHDPETHE